MESGEKWVRKFPRAKYEWLILYKKLDHEGEVWWKVTTKDHKAPVMMKESDILENYKKG
jgi:hypothetical protein